MAAQLKVAIFLLAVVGFNGCAQGTEPGAVPVQPGPAGPAPGGPCTFDITKYGATQTGDIAWALSSAWKEAIASLTPATVVVPPGTWYLSQVKLCGPNKAPVTLCIQGTIQADEDPAALPDKKCEWVTINYMCNLTITGGGVLDGRGWKAWQTNDCNKNKDCAKRPINMSLNFINNTIIEDITTKDSKNFHVNCIEGRNVTFQRFNVCAPETSINTDGIHIARSTLVKVIDTTIKTGDDCVSIGDETHDLTVHNVTCGPGHGVSIGSLGKCITEKDLSGVTVQNCTFTNTQNGVRIKTWPNGPACLTVSNIRFEDLIMNNVSNPIIIDQEYCPWNQCDKTKSSQVQICNVSIKNIKGTSWTCEGVVLSCSSSKPCNNVTIGDVDLGFTGPVGPFTTRCSNIKPIFVGKQTPPVCSGPAAAGLPVGPGAKPA